MTNKTTPDSFSSLVIASGLSALAAVSIVALAFCLTDSLSAVGLWAVAAMVACPCAMGLGMAYFLTREPMMARRGSD